MTSAFQGCALASSASIDWMARKDGIREAGNAAFVTQLIRNLSAGYCELFRPVPFVSAFRRNPGNLERDLASARTAARTAGGLRGRFAERARNSACESSRYKKRKR